jgi:hypothetical protein
MATLKLPKKFIERLKATAEAEEKTVEGLITDAVNAYIVRETAKEKGDPVPPEAELKERPVAEEKPKKPKAEKAKKKDK